MQSLKPSGKKKYSEGYKYCRRCEAFYPTESHRCPVCSKILRNSPRRKKLNSKAIEITPEIERELEKIEVTVRIINCRS